MERTRSFTRKDVEAVTKRLTDNRPAEVRTDAGKRILRETQFSSTFINQAFAKALAKQK